MFLTEQSLGHNLKNIKNNGIGFVRDGIHKSISEYN
ncbi:MAG: hypothetical protein ACI9LX_001603 [Paraglaciecola sp.]|jgi:hypothetical protein